MWDLVLLTTGNPGSGLDPSFSKTDEEKGKPKIRVIEKSIITHDIESKRE